MNEAWSLTRDIAEVIGMFFVPVMVWVLYTIVSHGKQIILLEEKVNDSLNRRMASIEDKVVGMENKIESKIDGLEKNVMDCKIAMNDLSNARWTYRAEHIFTKLTRSWLVFLLTFLVFEPIINCLIKIYNVLGIINVFKVSHGLHLCK